MTMLLMKLGKSMGTRIKYVAENSSDQSLKIRLANLIDSEDAKAGVAFDIKYHLACLISAERSEESSISQQSQPESDLSLLLSNMEIVEILELELNDSTRKILYTLYTALCLAQMINVSVVGIHRRTVITLDLDLYERAVKIRGNTGHRNSWVLRMGELHIIFSLLRSLGRYIEGSGLDDVWI